ncbi:MAG: transcription termination/antitermination protein NusG [Bacillota bacterium]|jgi:transcriptional antiterminator NusG
MAKEWFVIHTYSGYENKVKANLEKRVETMNMEDYIFRVIVPMEDEVSVKDGQKKVVQRKVFPGYVLVEMDLTDTAWYVVRNTTGVTGFVGAGSKPVPLSEHEVEKILEDMGMNEKKQYKIDFEIGDTVRVKDGPFDGFVGTVQDVDTEKGKVKVLVSGFGRDTAVELDYPQVEKSNV